MQRYSILGTLLSLVAVCSSSPVGAEQNGSTVNASPPSSCFAHPADLPGPLGAGLYPWDSPGCAATRVKWEKAHTKAVAAPEVVPPAPSTFALSNRPSTPTQEVDAKGLAFVTDGLAQPPANAQLVWLPKGTLFPVHTMQSYSTFEARRDGKLRFELDQDVVVNGFLVAMKGDTAEGSFPTVLTGRSFLIFRISGSLFQITVDKIYNFCGDEIHVDFDRTEYRSGRLGDPIYELGLVQADMDQHIIRGQEYVSFTSRPQKVCGVPTTEGNSPTPVKALFPTTH